MLLLIVCTCTQSDVSLYTVLLPSLCYHTCAPVCCMPCGWHLAGLLSLGNIASLWLCGCCFVAFALPLEHGGHAWYNIAYQPLAVMLCWLQQALLCPVICADLLLQAVPYWKYVLTPQWVNPSSCCYALLGICVACILLCCILVLLLCGFTDATLHCVVQFALLPIKGVWL